MKLQQMIHSYYVSRGRSAHEESNLRDADAEKLDKISKRRFNGK